MEIGSLAEWITGIAEVAAVVVALFLPSYQARKARKVSQQRIMNLVRSLLNDLLSKVKATPDMDIAASDEYSDFQKLVSILAVTDADLVNIDILRQIEGLLTDSDRGDTTEQLVVKVENLMNNYLSK
ncbi:hypothetical protein MOO45_08095 (plasmid) [Bombilactobacillus folatiphilus]|uniref:Uncharacterized protein n=1 Tax=Bombilactobacillus folatiphilus TaxID=2923362 RepID=A0ABY4PBE5_9LACO|nr:hypothetical protein [Bombilactobacillus folatiphilus]UQS81431.1 hypothetical protein MOO45_04170 [Bombilactobacillus folatiphilus]UQS82836.1 hypothetical protein MOO45_04125 [Bombilactobacillus folatiphilus]UQS82942.1 hypothetical protein MOO45_08095 [Bombilactobacillus folatiphilus]